MSDELIDVPWDRVRSGPMIRRADGSLDRAVTVERREETIEVWFHDGRRERHRGDERALVVIHRHGASPGEPIAAPSS